MTIANKGEWFEEVFKLEKVIALQKVGMQRYRVKLSLGLTLLFY